VNLDGLAPGAVASLAAFLGGTVSPARTTPTMSDLNLSDLGYTVGATVGASTPPPAYSPNDRLMRTDTGGIYFDASDRATDEEVEALGLGPLRLAAREAATEARRLERERIAAEDAHRAAAADPTQPAEETDALRVTAAKIAEERRSAAAAAWRALVAFDRQWATAPGRSQVLATAAVAAHERAVAALAEALDAFDARERVYGRLGRPAVEEHFATHGRIPSRLPLSRRDVEQAVALFPIGAVRALAEEVEGP
jgi:hypothetical protein